MTVAANVVSIADFRERRAPDTHADLLVLAETADRRIELAALVVRAGLAGGRVDWADSLTAAERQLTATSYRLHVLDLGTDPEPATPLVEAMLALPGRRTLLICHVDTPELDELRHRFPTAAVIAADDLTPEALDDDARHPPHHHAATGRTGLEGLIESTAQLRTSIAGIGRQMAAADTELDAGKALDGQIHLIAAMQRLAEVEARLGVLEVDLRAQIDRGHLSRP